MFALQLFLYQSIVQTAVDIIPTTSKHIYLYSYLSICAVWLLFLNTVVYRSAKHRDISLSLNMMEYTTYNVESIIVENLAQHGN